MFNNKFIKYGLFFLGIFILAIVIWYSPVLFKGYATYTISHNTLLARNIFQTGLYSTENDLNVLLSSNLIEEQGHLSAYGNKLTSLIYAKVFGIIGLPDENNFLLLSIIIHALTLLIFTGLVLYLFNFKTSLIFSLIYIFLPFTWSLPYGLVSYEFALFFLALFFLFYFYGIKQKYNYIYLGISGIFLALAGLSKETFFLLVPFLLIYLWLINRKRYLLYIFIPFIILFMYFWLPNFIHNAYIQMFVTQVSEEVKSADYSFYGHVYPDPYTYHFEQEAYLEESRNKIINNELVLAKEIERIKEFKNMGIWDVSLFDRIRAGLMLGSRHIFRFVSLEDVGGPFILILILLGLYSLRQENKRLFQFFVYWVFSAVFLMSFVVLVGRNHLMDFNWAIVLLISLGLLTLGKIVIDHFQFQTKKAKIIYLAILLAVLYQLVLANHIAWSRIYDNSSNLIIRAYSQEIKKLNISDNDVIAVNLGSAGTENLNYLTNKSVVLFNPETIKNLLEEDRLNFAFEQFNVKYILGYSDRLTKDIVNQTDVVNVASDSLEPAIPEMSRNKGWFMNLVK